jgi:myosin heavy subunit
MNTAEQPKKGSRLLLIILIIVLALINAGLWIMGSMKDKEQKTIIVQKEAEIVDLKTEFDSLKNEFQMKIQQIAELGGDTSRMGEKMRELEQTALKYQRDARRARAEYKKFVEEIGALKLMLTQKDEEIAQLKAANEQLNNENQGLKQEKVKLTESVNQLTTEKKELDKKVEMASVLRAENFKLAALTKSNKERLNKSKTQIEFKGKDLDRLKINFNIGDNKVAKQETKTLYFRLLEPDGAVLYDLAAGAGTFNSDGNDMYYTAKQDILFDNRKPNVEFVYKKGSDYKKGKHTVEIFCEGANIGSQQFVVK